MNATLETPIVKTKPAVVSVVTLFVNGDDGRKHLYSIFSDRTVFDMNEDRLNYLPDLKEIAQILRAIGQEIGYIDGQLPASTGERRQRLLRHLADLERGRNLLTGNA